MTDALSSLHQLLQTNRSSIVGVDSSILTVIFFALAPLIADSVAPCLTDAAGQKTWLSFAKSHYSRIQFAAMQNLRWVWILTK
jgi:hypothetical protein